MISLSLITCSFLLLNCYVYFEAEGVNIQIYEHKNFTGLVWESNSTSDCNNIPVDKITQVYSIGTDTCFIVYNHKDCKSRRSEKYMPGFTQLSKYQLGRYDWIQSFHICNKFEGGDQLNLDLTNYYVSLYDSPDVLKSYKNVCSCVNVPKYVHKLDNWSIDNHHNDLSAYFEPDCLENKRKSKFIAAGRNVDSVEMSRYGIRSFGPDKYSTYFQISCNSSSEETDCLKASEKAISQPDISSERIESCEDGIHQLRMEVNKLSEHVKDIRQEFREFIQNLKFGLHYIFA